MKTILMFRRLLLGVGLAGCLLAACEYSYQPSPGTGTSGSTEVTILVLPGDKGSALLGAINGAQRSVHMTMYILSSSAIRDALIARYKAGIEVKVVLNKDFPPGNGVDNQSAYDALKAAGVPVVWAPSTFTYTHEKCFVIDGKAAWIMTMNASTSGLMDNREYLAVDTTPADVTQAEAQFAADFAGTVYNPLGNLLVSPVTSRPGILSLISQAKTTLDFEAEVFADAEVTTALCSAQARGVTVRGVLSDTAPSQTQQNAVTLLKGCGVSLFQLANPYIHSKAIVADGQRVYVGSINFTMTSLDKNRELGLITATAAAVEPVQRTVAADIAAGKPL